MGIRRMSSKPPGGGSQVLKRVVHTAGVGPVLYGAYRAKRWSDEEAEKELQATQAKADKARQYFKKLETWDTGREEFALSTAKISLENASQINLSKVSGPYCTSVSRTVPISAH